MAERKYTGILAKRLVKPTLLSSDSKKIQFEKDSSSAIEALFREFDLLILNNEELPWRDLALALANRHVPAFGALRPGRPNKNIEESLCLFFWIELLMRRDKMTKTAALKSIFKAGNFYIKYETLRSRSKDIDRNILFRLLRDIFNKLEPTIGDERIIKALEEVLPSQVLRIKPARS